MRTQKERLIGTLGRRRVNRPELIAAHGFDTKYAMHVATRAAGNRLMTTGRLTRPMPDPDRSRVTAIRRGDVPIDETVREIEEVERRLERAVEQSTLRDEPDDARVDAFVLRAHRAGWGW